MQYLKIISSKLTSVQILLQENRPIRRFFSLLLSLEITGDEVW